MSKKELNKRKPKLKPLYSWKDDIVNKIEKRKELENKKPLY